MHADPNIARLETAFADDYEWSVPIRYTGVVPDPFREGREVIVTVRKQGAAFVGERDSLVTKCPSKFTDKPSGKA